MRRVNSPNSGSRPAELRIAALYALGGLARTLLGEGSFVVGRPGEPVKEIGKQFLGLDEDEHASLLAKRGAHGILVGEDRLREPPFEQGDAVDASALAEWYQDEDLGLYVSRRSIALGTEECQVTDSMLDGLAVSLGGSDKVATGLAQGGVTVLAPYASASFLRDNRPSPSG